MISTGHVPAVTFAWMQVENAARPDAAGPVADVVCPLLDEGADQIVLGCTHFPLLNAWIEAAVLGWRSDRGSGLPILTHDPAPAVARQVARVDPPGPQAVAPDAFWTTGDAARFAARAAEAIGGAWADGPCLSLPLTALAEGGL